MVIKIVLTTNFIHRDFSTNSIHDSISSVNSLHYYFYTGNTSFNTKIISIQIEVDKIEKKMKGSKENKIVESESK